MEFVTLEDGIFILLLLFLLSSALNYWLVATPSSCLKKEPGSGRDWIYKRPNKWFRLLVFLLVGAGIVRGIGILNTNDTSPKYETSLRGSDSAQKFEHISQVNDQDPLIVMPALIVEDDTYAADENEKDEDKDPCSVLLSERRENGWTEEDIGMCA